MSFGYLKMSERLRPWHTAGLRFLFPGSAGPDDEMSAEAQGTDTNTTSAANAPRPAGPDASQALPAAVLQQLYAKVSIPCFSVWTYWKLGEDLLQAPNPERRSRLAALMRNLGWPKGSITFWPIAIPVDDRAQSFASLFWQAVQKIQPRLLVAFGKDAFSALAPQKPFELFHCEGSSPVLVALPDILDVSPGSVDFARTSERLQELGPTSNFFSPQVRT